MQSIKKIFKYREAEMSDPIRKWLEDQGYTVYTEIPLYGRSIDMIGRKDNDLIVIEMAQCLTTRVRRQCLSPRLVTWKVFCAIRTNPRYSGIAWCRKMGIGILRVGLKTNHNKVWIHISPRKERDLVTNHQLSSIMKVLDIMEPGGIGGLPNLDGCGPAQYVRKKVIKYRESYPKATWKEIYKEVPNHYASYQSMQGAMRTLEEYLSLKKKKQLEKGSEVTNFEKEGICQCQEES